METNERDSDSCTWLVAAASVVLEGDASAKVDIASSLPVELVLLDHVAPAVHEVGIPEEAPVPGVTGPLVHADHGKGAV